MTATEALHWHMNMTMTAELAIGSAQQASDLTQMPQKQQTANSKQRREQALNETAAPQPGSVEERAQPNSCFQSQLFGTWGPRAHSISDSRWPVRLAPFAWRHDGWSPPPTAPQSSPCPWIRANPRHQSNMAA
ncbi:hypothetical protein M5D96_008359 [Drosophila gunungcola]|uniref:Uncharacterized protein n=1 Tax=Drosophila gunungcola TaxID=103775 RepID=A0A9P9YKC9_9MUSC|nr:hypothetical protein M5D96_008359 [Drosophila gunungcola]